MDIFLRLFDFFNALAKHLANFLFQSGSNLVIIFKNLLSNLLSYGETLDIWIGNHLGISINAFLSAIIKIITSALTFIVNLLKQLVGRIM